MADKKLAVFVTVEDEHGEFVTLEPGDTVPKELADKIGAHCFEPDTASVDGVMDYVAGPGQGLGALSEDDAKAVVKAREAAAKRRASRGTGETTVEPVQVEGPS